MASKAMNIEGHGEDMRMHVEAIVKFNRGVAYVLKQDVKFT